MKIFYFITKSENGGAQTVLYELLLAHKERGDDVCVMAYPGGWLEWQTHELGYRFFPNSAMKKTFNPFTLSKAGKIFKTAVISFSPDIVSCHSSFSGLVGRLSLRGMFPTIYTAHGWGFTKGTSFIRKLIAITGERVASRYCDAIVCVSEFDRKLALRFGITNEEHCITIRNGVLIGEYRADPSISEKIEIVFPGRLSKPKRQDLVVKALAQLPLDVRSKIHVTFCGGGVFQEMLQILAKKYEVEENITITGELPRNDTLACMASAQIFILLSDWEGLPMTILEALQLGLPCIANTVGGIPEVLDARQAIMIDTLYDVRLVSDALLKLILDKELRVTLGKSALERGKEFTREHMSDAVFDLYERVLKIRNANT
jgi:glycosyltransferase involved in cell wall biosynthesis